MFKIIKKLVFDLPIFLSITIIGQKANFIINLKNLIFTTAYSTLLLKYLSYIYLFFYFEEDNDNVKALIKSNIKINRIIVIYAKKLGFYI